MSSSDPPTFATRPQITLRAPTSLSTTATRTTTTTTATTAAFQPPPLSWLLGTWHVTHSTLPMWRKARNVAITYTPLSSSPEKLDDKVTYQSLSGSAKLKTISGVDTPAEGVQGAWNWRGNGWLMIASSRWEVLGWGDEEPVGEGEGEAKAEQGSAERGQWIVTYFAKTMFTPAGVDVYSRRKEGLGQRTLEAVREALGKVDAEVVRELAGKIFEVKRD